MATKQYKVTLTDDVVEFLRNEDSRGRLSEGIDRLVQRSRMQQPQPMPAKVKPVEKTLDLPQADDDDIDGRTARAQRNHEKKAIAAAAEKAAEEKEAQEDLRREYRARVRHGITHEKPLPYFDEVNLMFDDTIPADERQQITNALLMDDDVLVERDRIGAQFEKVKADMARDLKRQADGTAPVAPKVKQTLMLSQVALKALGLFGTPVDMPDDKIKEYNDYYLANPPAEVDYEG